MRDGPANDVLEPKPRLDKARIFRRKTKGGIKIEGEKKRKISRVDR